MWQIGAGLLIVDVSTPQNPVLIDSILPHPTSYMNTSLVQENRLYISDTNWNEISVYNISVPSSPILLTTYAWNLSTEAICISGNTLYTANGLYGLNIHNLTAVGNDDETVAALPPARLDNYPNPFRVNTTIAFSLPKADRVRLRVYNIKGQFVRELCNEFKSQGQHTLAWDGKDSSGREVPAGIYLARYNSGKHYVLKKITRF